MADTREKRARILSLVFTDLANSTALKSERGDAAIEALIARHAAHVRSLAADCGGRIIDWAGDGCFLTFDTSSSAVLFALRLQMAHSDEPDLPGVRVGVHMGEVTESVGDNGVPNIAGLAVDIASRISGLARPGQVLMSAAVYDSARQRIGVESLGKPILWQAHGTYAVKGFDKDLEIGEAGVQGIAPLTAPTSGDKAKLVRRAKHSSAHGKPAGAAWESARRFMPATLGAILVVALLGAAYLAGQFKTGIAVPAPDPIADTRIEPIKALAVLPLDDLSSDANQEYFADGMTEAITAELSKIKALKVISRTSAMRFKDSELLMSEIATQLGVDGLIEGSVQRDGDEVRVTVQLIDGSSDAHLWTNTYDSTMKSVLKLQSDVALAIADAIEAQLTGDERARIAKSHPVEPAAYDAYVRGMRYREVGTREQLATSIQLLEEATRLDPNFAEAWAELGYLYPAVQLSAEEGDRRETISKARAASLKALELDSDLPMVHFALGWIAMTHDRAWEQAERSFRRSLELDPNFVRGRFTYGYYFMYVGRRREAIEQVDMISDLDAQDPLTIRRVQTVYLRNGQAERASDGLERLLSAHPGFPGVNGDLMEAYLLLGDDANAIAAAEREVESSGRAPSALALAATAYALSGQADRARAALDEALRNETGLISPIGAVRPLVLLGDLDAAFQRMEAAFDAGDSPSGYMRNWPYDDRFITDSHVIRFRNDPRYRRLIDRIKLPPLPPDHPGYAEEQAWLAQKEAAADANAPIRKIAVLPFKNISEDPQQEFFVDGMTEALISELVKIKSITVISPWSAMHFKNSDKTLPEIARELEVDGLVTGSAMKEGNEVRMTAQLIRAATDNHLWAETYTRTLENVLKLQAEVALAITAEIKAVVTPDERSRVNAAKTVNIEAYELYIQGRRYWSLRSPEGFDRARDLFTKSLELDPGFALGHVGLADTYFVLSDYYLMPSAEALRLGREEAEIALALDPALGEAYATLGFIGMAQNWDWNGAEKAFLTAIELSPNHATAHHWYGVFLSSTGRNSHAEEQVRLAYQLDPASPVIAADYALRLVRNGQTQEAGALAERLEAQYPGNARVQMGLTRLYVELGRYDDTLAAAERMVAAEGSKVYASLYKAVALAHLGRADEARNLIEDAVLGADAISRVQIARAYTVLNDLDRAFEWLTKAADTHDPYVWRLKLFIEFDALESDPRYQALLRRMNFPVEQASP